MQNDTFKRFSKDLQDALVMPVNYINKKTKKAGPLNEKKKALGLPGLTITNLNSSDIGSKHLSNKIHQHQHDGLSPRSAASTSDCLSLHNFSLSTISKTSCDDNHSFTSSNGSTLGFPGSSQQQQQASVGNYGHSSTFLKSSGQSGSAFAGLGEEPPLVHFPNLIASLDQFSPERLAWVKDFLNQNNSAPSYAWDRVEGNYENQGSEQPVAPEMCIARTGFNNLNEATGLVLVKLMQVNNRASSKQFDIECSLRVAGVERTSHPSRSFKNNPGNTATMNEVFMFDVEKPFQLELEVTGTQIATKFGTMAGFSNTQTVHLGHLSLPLPLTSMEKSIRTYKLQRLNSLDGSSGMKSQSKEKADCEIVIMIGVHVLQEPVEDLSWETEMLYQGNLTVMTRGFRMAKRDPVATVPLAHVLGIQPPDFDKIDVSSNGFSVVISPDGVNMSNSTEFDITDMDYNIHAFTDSAYQHDCWAAVLEEAIEQYQENMVKREEVMIAKKDRRRRSMVGEATLLGLNSEKMWRAQDVLDEGKNTLIDLRFVS
ncbi:hypothetical protein BGZ98_000339 [Dissophora globulifera]|nr:hypothetical protein BGZ98_000339 [Dissophora globulifera]